MTTKYFALLFSRHVHVHIPNSFMFHSYGLMISYVSRITKVCDQSSKSHKITL
jgi:hypothetical protein